MALIIVIYYLPLGVSPTPSGSVVLAGNLGCLMGSLVSLFINYRG